MQEREPTQEQWRGLEPGSCGGPLSQPPHLEDPAADLLGLSISLGLCQPGPNLRLGLP